MKSSLGLLLACLITIQCLGTLAVNRAPGSLWPLPQAVVSEAEVVLITDSLNISSNLPKCDVLEQAIKRYRNTILQTDCKSLDGVTRTNPKFPKKAGKISGQVKRHHPQTVIYEREDVVLSALNVIVRQPCQEAPTDDMVERYVLIVNSPATPGIAQLTSETVWGAIRGLETFSQLVREENSQLVMNSTSVIDFPRFSYRGVLLDTARHFLPIKVILENLDAMAQNKMNVFQWHIVDDQSFPYQSTKFPKLSEMGAYDSNHVYTQKDVAEVIEYARLRGIRVIPEFDSPGHTLSWGKGEASLLTPCYEGSKPDGTFGPINPIVNATYDFLESFFGEIATVFPDSYLHLGGDEVDFACWKSNPNITDFMKKSGIAGDYEKLEDIYEQKLVNIVQKKLKKKTIVWQELIDNQVQVEKSTIVHVWKTGYQEELANVTKSGYNAILSACWYLNIISYGVDWPTYYKCDPLDFEGSSDQKKLVIGGAATMWAEYVDGTGVISRLWPRASTVAERLWSSASVTDVDEAQPRLEQHRCRMLQRGLRVEPPNGPGFCPCDPFI